MTLEGETSSPAPPLPPLRSISYFCLWWVVKHFVFFLFWGRVCPGWSGICGLILLITQVAWYFLAQLSDFLRHNFPSLICLISRCPTLCFFIFLKYLSRSYLQHFKSATWGGEFSLFASISSCRRHISTAQRVPCTPRRTPHKAPAVASWCLLETGSKCHLLPRTISRFVLGSTALMFGKMTECSHVITSGFWFWQDSPRVTLFFTLCSVGE